jgi:transcriptional regulator with XRE-family HTH domain
MRVTREVITERGFSIRKLANKTGIHAGVIGRALNGGALRLVLAQKIADVLDMPLHELDLRITGAGRPPLPPSLPTPAGLPKLLAGLFEQLPAPDSVWPEAKRAEWFNLAKLVFNLIYREPGQNHEDP